MEKGGTSNAETQDLLLVMERKIRSYCGFNLYCEDFWDFSIVLTGNYLLSILMVNFVFMAVVLIESDSELVAHSFLWRLVFGGVITDNIVDFPRARLRAEASGWFALSTLALFTIITMRHFPKELSRWSRWAYGVIWREMGYCVLLSRLLILCVYLSQRLQNDQVGCDFGHGLQFNPSTLKVDNILYVMKFLQLFVWNLLLFPQPFGVVLILVELLSHVVTFISCSGQFQWGGFNTGIGYLLYLLACTLVTTVLVSIILDKTAWVIYNQNLESLELLRERSKMMLQRSTETRVALRYMNSIAEHVQSSDLLRDKQSRSAVKLLRDLKYIKLLSENALLLVNIEENKYTPVFVHRFNFSRFMMH